MLLRSRFRALAVVALSLSVASPGLGDDRRGRSGEGDGRWEASVRPFLEQHCFSCHDEATANAGFRVDQLAGRFGDSQTAEQWVEVMNLINLGEMPPEGEPRPDVAQIKLVVDWISEGLRRAELAAKDAGGAIPIRRMNRDEYANTIRDLFELDPREVGPLVERLPADGSAEGFDRLGIALFFDQTQLDRSLEVAKTIADHVIVDMDQPDNSNPPEPNRMVFKAAEEIGPFDEKVKARFSGHIVDNWIPAGPAGYEIRDDGVELMTAPSSRHRGHEWPKIGQLSVTDFVSEDGFYRIRIRAEDAGNRPDPHLIRIEYQAGDFVLDRVVEVNSSGEIELLVFLERGLEDAKRSMRFSWNQTRDVIVPEPKYAEATKAMFMATRAIGKAKRAGKSADEIARLEEEKKALTDVVRKWTGPAAIWNPEIDRDEVARLFFRDIEVIGPIKEEWPPKSHQRIFFDGDERRDPSYAREIFTRLLPYAYRRPVTANEIDSLTGVVSDAMRDGLGFYPAMRRAVARMLVGPKFLYLVEPAARPGSEAEQKRKLNDLELATRLSYFLWSSMPDKQLFRLAMAGKLSDRSVLAGQVARMLDDPKSAELVENFAGQWLDVREFGTVEPAKEYRDYDEELAASEKEEPLRFFTEILAKDLPITNFIDSDFVMIDERLARHYGIPGVEGDEFRRVEVPEGVERGGVLGMAGLMTLLSDGTRTLPIRRATWVKTELFDDPPGNPPPNAGEIQPNTAGENLTVRERLEKHRSEPTCASCHASLDPFGLALENYDAIGAWRERANGEGFGGNNAPDLNVAATLPNGQTFDSLAKYKQALLKPDMRRSFAGAFTKHLMIYALGRPVGFTDDVTLEALVDDLERNDYAIRSLITGVVLSEPFLTK